MPSGYGGYCCQSLPGVHGYRTCSAVPAVLCVLSGWGRWVMWKRSESCSRQGSCSCLSLRERVAASCFLMPCCDPDLNSPMLELAILAEPRGAWSAGTLESSWDLFFPDTVHLIFPPSTARPCSHSVCLSIRCFLGTYFVPSTYETSPRQSRWTSLGPAHRTETGAGMETCPAKVGRCGFTFWRGCLSSSRV